MKYLDNKIGGLIKVQREHWDCSLMCFIETLPHSREYTHSDCTCLQDFSVNLSDKKKCVRTVCG